MKSKLKRILALFMSLVTVFMMTPLTVSYADDGGTGGLIISSPSDGGTINGYGTVRIKWNKYSGADHYWITIKDEVTNKQLVNEEYAGTTYRVYADDEIFTENGREYKIYVAAMDENGVVLNDKSAWNAIYVTNELELEAPEITSHGLTDTHCVDEPLYVSWDAVDGADDYKVYVKKLNGSPDFGNSNEAGTNISYQWSGNTEIEVAASKLVAGKYYKIALCATNTDQGVDSEWTSVYIMMQEAGYISVSENPNDLGAEKGSTESFWIESNVEWDITCDAPWLTWTITKRNNLAEVILKTASANTGTSRRRARLTISADGVEDQHVYIYQSAPEIELPSITDIIIPAEVEIGKPISYSAEINGNGALLKNVTVSIHSIALQDTVYFRNTDINAETYTLSGSVNTGGVVSGTDESGNPKTLDLSHAGEYQVVIHVSTNATTNNFIKTDPKIVTFIENPGTGILGDVNSDGRVTNLDRFVLHRYLIGMDGYTVNKISADIDKDGSITDNDADILTKHLAKWSGYENLDSIAPALDKDITVEDTTGDTAHTHTAVGGETVYSHHHYEQIEGNSISHTVAAIVWKCKCGECGESFNYYDTTGYAADSVPRAEAHQYDRNGICTRCLYRCTHNYVATGDIVKFSGVWEDCGDGTHVRTSALYIFECEYCGSKTQKRVNEIIEPQTHSKRNTDHPLEIRQLDVTDSRYYEKHEVLVDRWVYCSARAQGCTYESHTGKVTLTKNHEFVDGICECGLTSRELPIVIDDCYVKFTQNGTTEFVTGEGIEVKIDGNGLYCGIAVYDKSGKGLSGSSDTETYLFKFREYTNGVLNGKRVYSNYSQMNLNSGNNYVALRQDNYSLHCKETGKFYIDVYANGVCKASILVNVLNTNSKLMYGSTFYSEGEYGYSKVVEAKGNVLNLSPEAQRLWFDLNTPVGDLKLIENMPVYKFEFIDEEKRTLSGWWQLTVLSGVRQGFVNATDYSVKGILKKANPVSAGLVELMDSSDQMRKDAQIIADYLLEVDYNSFTERLPVQTIERLVSIADSKLGVETLHDIFEALDRMDESVLFNVLTAGSPMYDIYNHIKDMPLSQQEEFWANCNFISDVMCAALNADDDVGDALSMLFKEMVTITEQLNAIVVIHEIENGILELNVSEKLKQEVIKLLKDKSIIIDESLWNKADVVASSAANSTMAEIFTMVPGLREAYWTVSLGSSLLGYASFEDALAGLLEGNESYDKKKDALITALQEFRSDPSDSSYNAVITAYGEYELITGSCINLYKNLRIAEASSMFKKVFTSEQGYIDSANSDFTYDNGILRTYEKYVYEGSLK